MEIKTLIDDLVSTSLLAEYNGKQFVIIAQKVRKNISWWVDWRSGDLKKVGTMLLETWNKECVRQKKERECKMCGRMFSGIDSDFCSIECLYEANNNFC